MIFSFYTGNHFFLDKDNQNAKFNMKLQISGFCK